MKIHMSLKVNQGFGDSLLRTYVLKWFTFLYVHNFCVVRVVKANPSDILGQELELKDFTSPIRPISRDLINQKIHFFCIEE